MFFPCTHGEQVEIDSKQTLDGHVSDNYDDASRHSLNTTPNSSTHRIVDLLPTKKLEYIDKPTIIMCNPNALVY